MRTKINYKESVAHDMGYVNGLHLYMVFNKFKNFLILAEISVCFPILLLYRSFRKDAIGLHIDNFTAWYWESYRCKG